jgi:hypothetical protein
MSLRLWFHPAIMTEYAYNAGIRARRARFGHRHMPGSAEEVIAAGIARDWNGHTFTASPGHFGMFWTRDLCFSVPALLRIDEGERVRASLAWALRIWEARHSHITTTIHRFDYPVDVYEYGVDSLPLLLAALRSSDSDELVLRHRSWLSGEVAHFAERVVDKHSGLVRNDRKYSGHRDTVTNRSNAYGNTMVALLAKTIGENPAWGLPNPLSRFFADGDYGRLLRERFWCGDRYRDAIGSEMTSGEANVWPFYAGVESDSDMLAAALGTLEREGYADPLPLRYETRHDPRKEVWLARHLFPDYQGSTIWTSLGAMYLQLLARLNPAAAADGIGRYRALIERDGTFWEVLDPTGLRCWISSRKILIGEEAMLWGAIFLDLLRHPAAPPALLSPVRA